MCIRDSFKGVQHIPGLDADIPEEWLKMMMKKHLTPEEKAKLEKLGWDKLMEEFRKRLEEQKGRHAGGSKWIGTGGSSPFGHGGYQDVYKRQKCCRPASTTTT